MCDKKFLIGIVMLLSVVLIAACAPTPTPVPPVPTQTPLPPPPTPSPTPLPRYPEDVSRVSVEVAYQQLGKNNVVFIDTRPLPQYTSSHIKGAISVPMEEFESRLKELPRDKDLILYCA
jgi:3-mercaptopyruvate sulfurtransferase SseA